MHTEMLAKPPVRGRSATRILNSWPTKRAAAGRISPQGRGVVRLVLSVVFPTRFDKRCCGR